MLCFYLISFGKLCGINLKIGRIYQKKSRFSIFLMTSSENGSHFEECCRVNLQSKSMNWFLYNRDLRYERAKVV